MATRHPEEDGANKGLGCEDRGGLYPKALGPPCLE